MIKDSIKVEIALGLHARPLLQIVTSLKELDADVIAKYENREADLNSIMEALLLSAPCGTILNVEADGPDAEKAIEVIKKVLAMTDL